MAKRKVPTKSNLMKAQSSKKLAEKGYDLLDKKRTILIGEMMNLIDEAKEIQSKIRSTFSDSYKALQDANVTMGINSVEEIALSINKEDDFEILLRSVMGVEIPEVKYDKKDFKAQYGIFRSNPALDTAVIDFQNIKHLIYRLAEIENSVFKLATEIQRTQKRANALDKIQIPKYKKQIKYIEETLEEKEREDFFRLKKVKEKKK